jgi:hypothetical protein
MTLQIIGNVGAILCYLLLAIGNEWPGWRPVWIVMTVLTYALLIRNMETT